MKTLITIVAILMLTIPSIAQRRIAFGYHEIKRTQYDSCIITQYLVTNSKIRKQAGKLSIPITGRAPKIFKDDNSDTGFKQFEYLGDIKGTKLSLIKRTEYNSEKFYLVNRTSGSVATLIGPPTFAQNLKDFACINNPSTDEKQEIQVCEIKNGKVETRVFLNGKEDTFLEKINCIERNSILTKDNKGKYWKLNYKLGDK